MGVNFRDEGGDFEIFGVDEEELHLLVGFKQETRAEGACCLRLKRLMS